MPIFRLLYSRQYFPYILFALFLAVVPLYFVYSIFIAVLPLCFLRYIHESAALTFCTLYPWLYEVVCCRDSQTRGGGMHGPRKRELPLNS